MSIRGRKRERPDALTVAKQNRAGAQRLRFRFDLVDKAVPNCLIFEPLRDVMLSIDGTVGGAIKARVVRILGFFLPSLCDRIVISTTKAISTAAEE